MLVLAGTILLGSMLLVTDYLATEKDGKRIYRNDYGKEQTVEERRIQIDGTTIDERMEIEVASRKYTLEQQMEVLKEAEKQLSDYIIGENESLDHVKTDLDLITKIPEQSIFVRWELSSYEYINLLGELNEEKIQERIKTDPAFKTEGEEVVLFATLEMTDGGALQAVSEIPIRIFPPFETREEELLYTLEKEIKEKEINTQTKEMFQLPDKVGTRKISYENGMDKRGVWVVFLGALMAVLLVLQKKEKAKQEQEKKKTELIQDYPEIVSKLSLLLGAGLTVKNAWKRMIFDYERRREKTGERIAYEEMILTYRELQSGVSEAEGYERFGKRCGVNSYVKLGLLLSQNLRKGTRGLTELLRLESVNALEERKAYAKRQGEIASTKLLFPMFLMLGVVLVIVIVPAFLTIQL